MVAIEIVYQGELRCEAIHTPSCTLLQTDAPKDNNGKGESFSPTDLVATALGACMLTVMGIKAQNDKMTSINGTTALVTKVMYADPRRVGEIHVKLTFPKNNFSEKERKIYENTAHTCPVAKSLHPDLKQVLIFEW